MAVLLIMSGDIGHGQFLLPEAIDLSKAGPLLCGGITVFNPIILAGVKPTDTVGVIGIGGLGHMALKFLKHWGCEVIAFSSNPDKKEQILNMGATKGYQFKISGRIRKYQQVN